MDPLPASQSLLSALSLSGLTLFALALGLFFYGYLADRVIFQAKGCLRTDKFGIVDAFVATLLGFLFILSVAAAIQSPGAGPREALPSPARMIEGVVFSTALLAVVVGGILGGLSARSIRWREVFGFDRVRPEAVVGYAVLSLALALPLIGGGSILSRLLLAAGGSQDDSAQELVRFLGATDSGVARTVVGISAVFAAPILEEMIFRGFLYGTIRHYAGITAGIIGNAFLFAAIHTHLPSFGGLFVLAVCLSLAYEWTGSIFVPITMHAMFNALSVATLLHGGGANG